MALNWQHSIANSFLFAKISQIPSFNNILIFDLDGTLITTKSKRVFSKDNNDWEIIHANVISKLKSLTNTLIIIISNQSGLSNDIRINDWKVKIENILKVIPFHIVFASIGHNEFRKPFDGSWLFIKKFLANNNVTGNNNLTNNLTDNNVTDNNNLTNNLTDNNVTSNNNLTNNLTDNNVTDNNLTNNLTDNNVTDNNNNLTNNLTDNNVFDNNLLNNIIFVGDAFGRVYSNDKKNDFSDSDLKFALNCGFKYATPEKFFNYNYIKVDFILTNPILPYYSNNEFNKIMQTITEQIESSKSLIYITIIGYPASGKSYLTKKLLENYDITKNFNIKNNYNICVLNNDTKQKLIKDNCIIINDNTNLTQKIINDNNDYAKNNNLKHLVIKFDYNEHILEFLNAHRTYHYGKYINSITYNVLKKKNDINNFGENVIVIEKIFPEVIGKLKYYV